MKRYISIVSILLILITLSACRADDDRPLDTADIRNEAISEHEESNLVGEVNLLDEGDALGDTDTDVSADPNELVEDEDSDAQVHADPYVFEYKNLVLHNVYDLSDAQLLLAEDIMLSIDQYRTSVDLHGLSQAEFRLVYEALFSANPLVALHDFSVKPVFDEEAGLVTFSFRFSEEEHLARVEEWVSLVSEVIEEAIPYKASEEEMARALYLYMAQNFLYAYELLGETVEEGGLEGTYYQAFLSRSGLCAHSAILYCYLLNQVGVDNYYVMSLSANLSHAWTLVALEEGVYYHCDPTFEQTDWSEDNKSWTLYYGMGHESRTNSMNTDYLHSISSYFNKNISTIIDISNEDYPLQLD